MEWEFYTLLHTRLDTYESHPVSLREQFQKLVLESVQCAKDHMWVIVIDALDECDGENDILQILHNIERLGMDTDVNIRAFVTSRPELPIWI